MKLKKHELKGPVTIVADEIIWIFIQETSDSGDLISELLTWTHSQGMYRYNAGGMVGGGQMSYGWLPQDGKRIIEWLKERGAVLENP